MMNKPEILRKIGNIIKELQEQHQYLSETPKINILELELFIANADFLIDHIEILKKLNNNNEHPQHVLQQHIATQPEEVKEIVKEEAFVEELPELSKPAMITTAIEDIAAEEQITEQKIEDEEANEFKFSLEEPVEMVFDFEKELPVTEVFDRPLTSEEQEVIEQKQQNVFHKVEEESIIIPEPVNYIQEEIKAVAKEEEKLVEPIVKEETFAAEDPFLKKVDVQKEEEVIQPLVINTPSEEKPKENHVLSLNELLSAKTENKSNSPLAHTNKPTVDLKAAISLNDKMMFIRELFNGYNLAYSEAIEILNRFDSFESADNFLMKNYAEKNNWAAKQDVVDRLYNIINRKFKS